jgi:hypothetical protein
MNCHLTVPSASLGIRGVCQVTSLSMDGIRSLNGPARYFLTVSFPLMNAVFSPPLHSQKLPRYFLYLLHSYFALAPIAFLNAPRLSPTSPPLSVAQQSKSNSKFDCTSLPWSRCFTCMVSPFRGRGRPPPISQCPVDLLNVDHFSYPFPPSLPLGRTRAH